MKTNNNASTFKKLPSRRITGQGMTEYIIVLALVALSAVVAVGFFGDTVQSQFAGMGLKLTGNDGTTAIGKGATAAGEAEKTIDAKETLGTYAK